jgi:CheY-like chemotaxis protein
MNKKNILIVDDEKNIVMSLSDYLDADYNCYKAYSVDEAIQIMTDSPVDVVISDVRMPGKTGFDLIRWLKENKPKTKTIMMTAYGSDSVKRAIRKEGAIFYFEKPIDYSEIKNIIEHIFSPRGFTADLSGMDLIDMLQILGFSGKDCTVTVRNRLGESGKIFLKNGVLLNAETDFNTGLEAFYDIIKWESGSFSVGTFEDNVNPEVSFSLEHLLLEVSRIRDESDREYETAKEKAVSGDYTDFFREMKDNLEECVALFVKKGKTGNIIVSIVDDGKYAIDSAIKNYIPSKSSKIELDDMLITLENLYIIVQQLNNIDLIIFAVFKKSCNVGLKYLTISKYKPLIEGMIKK